MCLSKQGTSSSGHEKGFPSPLTPEEINLQQILFCLLRHPNFEDSNQPLTDFLFPITLTEKNQETKTKSFLNQVSSCTSTHPYQYFPSHSSITYLMLPLMLFFQNKELKKVLVEQNFSFHASKPNEIWFSRSILLILVLSQDAKRRGLPAQLTDGTRFLAFMGNVTITECICSQEIFVHYCKLVFL